MIALAGVISTWQTPRTASASSASTGSPASSKADVGSYKLVYGKDGDLTPPLNYREWVFLSSGLDMSYHPKAGQDMSMFSNIFVNPEAYRSYLGSGHWPDRTVLVLEGRAAESKGSINKSGHFQSGGVLGLELHLKDERRFPGQWAFFDVVGERRATLIPQGAPCYSCHADHAAVDTTFVQFYPTLMPIVEEKGNLSGTFLKEKTAAKGK